MTTVRCVLFDFDGTLADTLPLTFKAFREVFLKFDGRRVTEDEIIAMFGPTEDDILKRNLRNKNEVERATEDYYDLYKQGHRADVHNHPQIIRMLSFLKQKGVRIGVVTGKSRRAYEISAEALGLSGYFEAAVTGDDVSRPKPDPQGVWLALEKLGESRESAAFVGDSDADIRAGKAAGVRTYAVQWMSASQSQQYEVQPDAVFTSAQQFWNSGIFGSKGAAGINEGEDAI